MNKTQGATNVGGIYAQVGINLVSFTYNNNTLVMSEIANNLHLTGGFLWMYDRAKPVEHGFFVWPEDILASPSGIGGGMSAQVYFYEFTYEWTDASGNIHRSAPSVPLEVDLTGESPTPVTFTAVFDTGVTVFTVSSTSGLFVGQVITDTTTPSNLTAGTKITAISGPNIFINLPTAGMSAASPGDTLTTSDTLSVTLNVPALRQTYKTGNNPVRIVGYRWSEGQQIYYQFTSILNPTLNDTTIDYVTITDTSNDAAIVGNVIIYTTGGVVEDIAAPACTVQTLYKTRLMLVDAEDQNLIWFSKQVIENVPVEMSDLLTLYAAPTIGSQGSTGPITALSSLDDKFIVFRQNAIYYLTGDGPDNTGANSDFSDFIFITSTVGCITQNSIVFMPQGLMFQSDKGIWLLGRDLSTSYIGAPVETLTIGNLVESALNIPETNEVRFTLTSGITLMYDYFYGQWGTFTNIPALSSTLYQNLHTYLNNYGQVFQESPGIYLDGSNPVLMSLTTSWLNLGVVQAYQRAYWFFLLGEFITPHFIQVQVSYDYETEP